MLVRLFSGPCFVTFKKKNPIDYMDMMRSFEERKKAFKLHDIAVKSRISAILLEMSEKICKSKFEDIVSDSLYAGNFHLKRNKLCIDANVFRDLFKNSLSKLIADVNEVLQHDRCKEVRAIMLVGGYADCELLLTAVKQAFPDKDVFAPYEGILSVLKGAVIYGHTPKIVTSRIYLLNTTFHTV